MRPTERQMTNTPMTKGELFELLKDVPDSCILECSLLTNDDHQWYAIEGVEMEENAEESEHLLIYLSHKGLWHL